MHSTGGKGDCKRLGVLYWHVYMAPTCTADGKVVERWGENGKKKQHLDTIKVVRKSKSKKK